MEDGEVNVISKKQYSGRWRGQWNFNNGLTVEDGEFKVISIRTMIEDG